MLEHCRDVLPQTAIHVLTNGRGFASSQTTKAWSAVGHPNLMAGIPVCSAVDTVHDYVVQAQGAFDETVLGVLKLKDQGQRVEIRVVLHAITAPRIVETCRWLARNLPIVDHVALMGLENTGFAIANDQLLWIDPVDYREQLAEGVHTLVAAKVNVSVYNLPFACWPHRYGLTQCNLFPIGRTPTLESASVASRNQDALAFSRRDARNIVAPSRPSLPPM